MFKIEAPGPEKMAFSGARAAEGHLAPVLRYRKPMTKHRSGFTLIELLIVVVIIGILAAIAIPKFAATKDKAMLASVRTDIRNSETAEESYFSDYNTYGTIAQLQALSLVGLSPGNTMTITAGTSGYSAAANNSSITSTITSCKVQVGGGATSSVDGAITCP
jgi:prepilin-type N-terminal cleavage/methylation domain-containing protein